MEGEDRQFEGWHKWKGARRVQSFSWEGPEVQLEHNLRVPSHCVS